MDLGSEAEFFIHQVSLGISFDPFPGQAVPVIDHPLSKEPFLNVPPKLPQCRFMPFLTSYHCHQKEERGDQPLSLHCLP